MDRSRTNHTRNLDHQVTHTMSTKSTPKKKAAKKPDEPTKQIMSKLRAMDAKLNVCMSRAEHIILSLDSHWGKREEHNDWMMPKLVDIRNMLQALSTPPAAPKEAEQPKEWVPKVGELVKIIGGFAGEKIGIGEIREVVEIKSNGTPWIGGAGSVYEKVCCADSAGYGNPSVDWREVIRPVTEAEIAAHKEKEAKQAEADKLAKLKWGMRVKYQDQDALYIGFRRGCHTVMVDGYLTPHITSTLSDITLIEP